MPIHLNDVLNQMQMVDGYGNPQPFDIEWYTCDLTHQTGGELRRIKKAVLTKNVKNLPRIGKGQPGKRKINEFKNMHRNVLDTQEDVLSRMYKKVHIRLITRFNNQKVEW